MVHIRYLYSGYGPSDDGCESHLPSLTPQRLGSSWRCVSGPDTRQETGGAGTGWAGQLRSAHLKRLVSTGLLRLIPQRVHLFQLHIRQIPPLLFGIGFDITKPFLEFHIRPA